MNLFKLLPWQVKFLGAIYSSFIPRRYTFLSRLNIGRHGLMDSPEYAYNIFQEHFNTFRLTKRIIHSINILELGPGDSIFSGLIAHAIGVSKSYLIDNGFYATRDYRKYQRMIAFLNQAGYKIPQVLKQTTFEEIADTFHIEYLHSGLHSLKTVPADSIDFIFSNAVLEHVKRNEVFSMIKEMRRVIKETGICSHTIDMKDHFNGSINHLRFSHSFWESKFHIHHGNYTNRIRYNEFIHMFKENGFKPQNVRIKRYSRLLLEKNKNAPPYNSSQDKDLRICEMHITLIPR
jgi:predicted SAM-dependent methyltransferase